MKRTDELEGWREREDGSKIHDDENCRLFTLNISKPTRAIGEKGELILIYPRETIESNELMVLQFDRSSLLNTISISCSYYSQNKSNGSVRETSSWSEQDLRSIFDNFGEVVEKTTQKAKEEFF